MFGKGSSILNGLVGNISLHIQLIFASNMYEVQHMCYSVRAVHSGASVEAEWCLHIWFCGIILGGFNYVPTTLLVSMENVSI